ncbi:hypothetical protein [Streptomyces sp. NPDC086777]
MPNPPNGHRRCQGRPLAGRAAVTAERARGTPGRVLLLDEPIAALDPHID